MDEAGVFHKIPRMDDSRLADIFARKALAMLVGRKLLNPEWAERILSWRHTGFSVHSRVRARTRDEAKGVGKHMIRPLLSLERLSLDEKGGKVCYHYGKGAGELERMTTWASSPESPPTSPTKARSWSVIAASTPTPKFIDHFKLTFVADKPPPSNVAFQKYLMADILSST